MSGGSGSPAMKRYQTRFWALTAAYAVAIFGVAFLIKFASPPAPWRYAAAVVPAAPLVGIIIAMGLYVRDETDEFRRAVYVQSMLWSLGFVLCATTIWGMLELLADAPHLQPWWNYPMFAVGQGVAQVFIRRSYR